jgi:DNA-3-methyladenine glycosylase II
VTAPRAGRDEIPLATRGPFHLEATVRVLQRRPVNRVDLWERDRYRRVLATAGGVALVEVTNRGTLDAPDVRLAIRHGRRSAAARRAAAAVMREILGLDVDPDGLQQCAATDRALRATVRALRGMRPPRFPDLFEAFANVVPFQQVSLDAGVAIVGRLVERFGESIELDGRRYFAFPSAAAVAAAPVDALRACGMSRRKAETLRHAARAIASGALTEAAVARLGTAAALRTLVALPGIGPWSAALVLLRGLGRIDVFPPGDVGAARGLGALLDLDPAQSFERTVERFGDRRGYLYFCALGASLLAKGLIHPAPQAPSSRVRATQFETPRSEQHAGSRSSRHARRASSTLRRPCRTRSSRSKPAAPGSPSLPSGSPTYAGAKRSSARSSSSRPTRGRTSRTSSRDSACSRSGAAATTARCGSSASRRSSSACAASSTT